MNKIWALSSLEGTISALNNWIMRHHESELLPRKLVVSRVHAPWSDHLSAVIWRGWLVKESRKRGEEGFRPKVPCLTYYLLGGLFALSISMRAELEIFGGHLSWQHSEAQRGQVPHPGLELGLNHTVLTTQQILMPGLCISDLFSQLNCQLIEGRDPPPPPSHCCLRMQPDRKLLGSGVGLIVTHSFSLFPHRWNLREALTQAASMPHNCFGSTMHHSGPSPSIFCSARLTPPTHCPLCN